MTKNPSRHILVLLLAAAFTLLTFAGSGHLFTSGRLSSSLINCVIQDRYGYIWVGTEYGLNKFDGYHFSTYLYNKDDTTSVADNTITDFLIDHDGRLWIGTAKGLMRYDYHENNFVRYPLPQGRRPRIYSLIESRSGDILIGTAGSGLFAIKKGADAVERESAYIKSDTLQFFTHIYEDRRGNLWQSSHLDSFTCYHNAQGRVTWDDYSSSAGAPVAFSQTDDHNLLIVCTNGILNYNYDTRKVDDAGYKFDFDASSATITTAMFDHDGNLYLGTSEHGVLFAAKGSKAIRQYDQPNKDRFDLTKSYVRDIFEDKDNNLWIGCYRKGLYLVNNDNSVFAHWKFAEQNYSIGSSVSSVIAGDDSTTWCTVLNSGVYQFAADGKIIAHPSAPSGTGLIYRDYSGQYWIGTNHGLYSYNPVSCSSVKKVNYDSDGTPCVVDDGKGKLFISAYSRGLYVYDVNSGSQKVLNMSQRSRHGHLCNDWIRSMMIDSRGLLWMATSNGVSCMNTSNYAFDTFGWNSILHNIQSNYLCEDKSGNIVIGTDDGLYYFNRKTNKVDVFPHSEQLNGKQICGIVSDKSGDLWISTTKEVWQYNHVNGQFNGLMRSGGMKSEEYSQGSVLHAADDRVVFGTTDGLLNFYPDNVRNNHFVPGEVYLTNFVVDGKSIDCLTDEFSIPYSENSFSLEFSLLNYKNIDDISFEYRINDGEWMSNDKGVNTISFTKMEPGHYDIDVRSCYNGIPSDKVKTINVVVGRPWYASAWAMIVYILLLGAAGYGAFWFYTRRKKAELEESKMRFLIDATHDIKSPLTLIVGPLKKLKARLSDDEASQYDIQTIDRNAQRLLVLVNQILDERRIDKNQLQLHCQKTDMVEFVGDICNLYKTSAEDRHITLDFVPNVDKVEAWIDRVNFDKVVSNLLSNALKYTFEGGAVSVVVDNDGKNFRLDVIDTGIGIKEDKTSRIFDRFYRGQNSQGVHIEGAGIGLNLCRSIVVMHGGKISAANRDDVEHGSIFTVTIPLGNSHLKPEEIMIDDDVDVKMQKSKGAKNKRILIVDDDREIALYIFNELSHWYHFDYSPNGRDALKKLLTDHYDLVVSDVKMPVMDGITLLKKIKSNSNIFDIPVILLTSKADVSDRLEGLERGADGFLAKPFNMDELHALINNLVGNVQRLRGKFTGAQEQRDKVAAVTVKGNDDALMERIMEVINKHIADPDFNVEMLAKEAGISRAQLHRKMKEMTGIPTGEFIRNLRLKQAARLLSEGKINITQVAFAVGFNNQTHFSTVFKKHFGMTPTEYGEKVKSEE